MQSLRRLIYSLIAALCVTIIVAFSPHMSYPLIALRHNSLWLRCAYRIGLFLGQFFVIYGLSLAFVGVFYLIYTIFGARSRLKENEIFVVGLVVVSLFVIATQIPNFWLQS